MKKIFAALIAMLLVAVLPIGAMAGIDTGVEAKQATTADNIIVFTIYTNTADELNDDNLTVTATNKAHTDYTAIDYIKNVENKRGSVTARFIADDLGITNAGSYEININIKGDDGASLLSEDVEVTVVAANPSEALPGQVIEDLDIDDNDLTFGDEVEFDLELGDLNTGDVAKNVYFEVALFQNGEKVAGWIESEDEFRLDDDGTIDFTQDDLRKPLMIPSDDDIDEGTLTMKVRVFGDYDIYSEHLLDTHEENFDIERLDDHLVIESFSVEQVGNVLYSTIVVQNDGTETQQNVQARVQIPELDINVPTKTVTVYEDDTEIIRLPILLEDVATGEYNIKVTVSNSDVSVSQTIEDFALEGIVGTQGPADQPRLIIGVDQLNKQISEQGAVYIMTFTNNGNAVRTLSIETAGIDWAQASVNPGTIVINPKSSEIVSIFVAPREDANGIQQFTVFVKEDNQIIKTLGMTAQITGAATNDGGLGYESLINSGLKWIAAILIVVLIILFVAWSWRREEARSEVY